MIQASDFPTREAFLKAVTKQGGFKAMVKKAKVIKEQDAIVHLPCIHRGKEFAETECSSCGSSWTKVYRCAVHNACAVSGIPKDKQIKRCEQCTERTTGGTEFLFADFVNRYAGKTGLIIGRGRATFGWGGLKHHDGPIFAVNDAALKVHEHAPDHEASFMHAQDRCQKKVIPLVRAICVIPAGGDLSHDLKQVTFPSHVRYLWYTKSRDGDEFPLRLTREQLAVDRRLFRGEDHKPLGSPTILQAIHWAWYTGCDHVSLIGCSGEAEGYAPDMPNVSGVEAFKVEKYPYHRQEAEKLMQRLGMTYDFR